MRRELVIAAWARRARKAAGFDTSAKAAEAAGVDAGWLRSVESGHIVNPGRDKLARLAGIYGEGPPDLGATQPEDEIAEAAALVLDAYQRGLREGLRIARGEPE